ncbi:hypothetical protein TNCV_4549611 [Trichonephila clavipes]|nr:hypothetical protein TNCV_4549611 [Trichonephila clavipes]
MPVVGLSLEHHTGDSMIQLGEIPEGVIEHYDRWHHSLSPPSQFRHGTDVGGFSPVPCIHNSAYKTFGPTDLTSTYSVCTRRVFGGTGIEPRPSGMESGGDKLFHWIV